MQISPNVILDRNNDSSLKTEHDFSTILFDWLGGTVTGTRHYSRAKNKISDILNFNLTFTVREG